MKNNNIKTVQRLLMGQLLFYILLSAVAVFAYETEILVPGVFADDSTLQYGALMVMELLTICTIPLSLKLFSFKKVKTQLERNGLKGLRLFGTLRINMLGIPVLMNTFFYYQFVAVAFAYMAIIGLLCVTFVYPSMGRCMNEIQCEK